MKNEKLIIENSHLQSNACRFGQGAVTLVFWCLWAYLLLPLASPIIDLLGLDITYYFKIDLELLVELFITVSFISSAAIISMALWSMYNFLLYRMNQNKQQWPSAIVMNRELATFFGVELSELKEWQYARELNIQLTEQGNIQYVDSRSLSGNGMS